jgi:aminoglycoside 2''-phosphotransferase
VSLFSSDQTWAWNGLDHSSAATLLANHLPAADHTSLEPFGHGDFCLAFKLGNQVIRVARPPNAATALRREACVLAAIAARRPLPVPRPTYLSPSACPPFIVHDEVVGEFLTRDDWANMPTVAREQAAADLATFLRALHSLPTELGLKCELVQFDGVALARRLREATAHTIHGLLDRETQGRLDETLERWSLPSRQEGRRPVLLHCDIAPGHLLYDPLTGSLTGMIDFGDIAVGDPARDFIYVYEDYGPTILTEVLSRYAGEDAPSMPSEIRNMSTWSPCVGPTATSASPGNSMITSPAWRSPEAVSSSKPSPTLKMLDRSGFISR